MEIIDEIKVHNHGFVKLVGTFGSDESIESAARISYGSGTRKKTETRGLLRYLMKHKHTSPFEMCEVQFHIKLPIFIMRQIVRHRTASLNEYSLRYSEAISEFYMPEDDHILPQSTTNKQGGDGEVCPENRELVKGSMEFVYGAAIDQYSRFVEGNPLHGWHTGFPGLSRELSRAVLPVGNYTEVIWKCDLHNFFHFLKLRTDSHAQIEVQDYANAMMELAEEHFPLSFEAWRDYGKDSVTVSRMEKEILKDLIAGSRFPNDTDEICKHYGISKRELRDFKKTFGIGNE